MKVETGGSGFGAAAGGMRQARAGLAVVAMGFFLSCLGFFLLAERLEVPSAREARGWQEERAAVSGSWVESRSAGKNRRASWVAVVEWSNKAGDRAWASNANGGMGFAPRVSKEEAQRDLDKAIRDGLVDALMEPVPGVRSVLKAVVLEREAAGFDENNGRLAYAVVLASGLLIMLGGGMAMARALGAKEDKAVGK